MTSGYTEEWDDDPRFCLGMAEPDCDQSPLGGPCTKLYGQPAVCGPEGWCRTDDTETYLGCIPFTVCKLNLKAVCSDAPGEATVITQTCVPPGYHACGELADDVGPPAICD